MNIVTQLVQVRKEADIKLSLESIFLHKCATKAEQNCSIMIMLQLPKVYESKRSLGTKWLLCLEFESIIDCKRSIFFPGWLEFLLSSLNHLWQISSSLFLFYQRPLTKAWTDHQKMQTRNEAATSPITESIKRYYHQHQDRFASESWNTFTGIQHTIQCSNGAWLERVI